MAWYHGTFSCGHEGRVNIVGPVRDREWKSEREFRKMCTECWEKYLEEEKERKNKEAMELAKEMDLPELEGTEKQVAWANTLRQKMIDSFEIIDAYTFERYKRIHKNLKEKDVSLEDMQNIKLHILQTQTKASYYIDSRFDTAFSIADRECKNVKDINQLAIDEVEKELEKEVRLESTVFPENKKTNAVAEISFNSDLVTATFERNDEFRKLVRELGYRWNGSAWERKMLYRTGAPSDRAAELGNALLNAGFPILIFDKDTRDKAINGTFEPEHKRWITKLKDEDRFAIIWVDGSDMYKEARSLPGSKWENPFVTVSAEHYEIIEEFAELHGFKFAQPALDMTLKYREQLQNVKVVTPAKVEEKELVDGLKQILESGDDILDDLKD